MGMDDKETGSDSQNDSNFLVLEEDDKDNKISHHFESLFAATVQAAPEHSVKYETQVKVEKQEMVGPPSPPRKSFRTLATQTNAATREVGTNTSNSTGNSRGYCSCGSLSQSTTSFSTAVSCEPLSALPVISSMDEQLLELLELERKIKAMQ